MYFQVEKITQPKTELDTMDEQGFFNNLTAGDSFLIPVSGFKRLWPIMRKHNLKYSTEKTLDGYRVFINESKKERTVNNLSYVYTIIRNRHFIARTDLLKKLYHIKSRELDIIISELINSGKIEANREYTGGKPRIVYRRI